MQTLDSYYEFHQRAWKKYHVAEYLLQYFNQAAQKEPQCSSGTPWWMPFTI
jgi:hypothetical protein